MEINMLKELIYGAIGFGCIVVAMVGLVFILEVIK